MLTCTACGAESPDGFKFCGQCGAPLAAALAHPDERKVVTTLFCDLVGFTAACERADPEDVDEMLRGYGRAARRAIESFGGTVEKFIGDAVVAVFGVPVVHEDDPERAVRAGLRLVELVAQLPLLCERPLQVRVGINTGEALVRLDVEPGSGEGFLAGDAVNVAARLQGAAPPMGVVAGELTRGLTAKAIDYESLGPLALKGKTEPLEAWLALGPAARTGLDPSRDRTPFVGRAADLATLDGAFDEAVRTGTSTFVLVVGEPGMGKSRLLREFAAVWNERPQVITWRQGRCLPYGDGVTFSAVADIVRAHAGILESDDAGSAGKKLNVVLPDDEDRAWLGRRLGQLLNLSTSPSSREESFAAWRRFLVHISKPRPTVLVIEDLHWADEAMLAFVDHLRAQRLDAPVLVVATTRPELLMSHAELAADAPGSADATRRTLWLAPLDAEDTDRLLTTLLDAGIPAEIQERVLDRVGGNPLFAEEYVRLLLDRGLLVVAADGLRLTAGDSLPLPDTVQAVLAARLDALPVEQKAVLCDAAVLGESFWSGAIATLADRDPGLVDDLLAGLVRRELIRLVATSTLEGEREFTFWHALSRDVAYAQLPRRARLAKHIGAARWIESKAGDRREAFAEILAHHYVTALELAEAVRATDEREALRKGAGYYLAIAGERAFGLDLATAARYLRRALDLLPDGAERGRVASLLGKALCLTGHADEGMDLLRQAAEALRAGGDRNAAARCLMEVAMWSGVVGAPDPSTPFEEGMALLDIDHPTPDVVRTLLEAATHQAIVRGGWAGAIEAANGALAVARRLDLPVPGDAYAWRAEGRAALGDPDWFEDYERALAESEHCADAGDAARTAYNYTLVLGVQSGPKAMLERVPRNIDFARRRGLEYWELGGHMVSACGFTATGEWDRSLMESRDVLEPARTAGLTEYLAFCRGIEAILVARRGGGNASDGLLEWLVGVGCRHSIGERAGLCQLAAAALAHRMGRPDLARSLLVTCLDGPGAPPWGVGCEASFVGVLPEALRVAVGLGDDALARRFAEEARAVATIDRHSGVYARALLEELGGRHEAAAAGFADAAARWKEFGVPYEEAQALLGRGRCLVALGRAPEAAPVLEQAREIFAPLGAIPALEETEALLRTS